MGSPSGTYQSSTDCKDASGQWGLPAQAAAAVPWAALVLLRMLGGSLSLCSLSGTTCRTAPFLEYPTQEVESALLTIEHLLIGRDPD